MLDKALVVIRLAIQTSSGRGNNACQAELVDLQADSSAQKPIPLADTACSSSANVDS